MLPASMEIGNVTYSVERVEPSEDLNGETDWKNARIVVKPDLQGEVVVATFLHELAHAFVYAAGQHADNERVEDYVSTLGHVLHHVSRANPDLVRYLADPVREFIPGSVVIAPLELDVLLVAGDDIAPETLSDFSLEAGTIKIEQGLSPDIAAWELANAAIGAGFYQSRATEVGDRYVPRIFPVASQFIGALQRNPAFTELLLAPIQRAVPLQVVQEPEAGGLTLA